MRVNTMATLSNAGILEHHLPRPVLERLGDVLRPHLLGAC
jgi:hypothetical protein